MRTDSLTIREAREADVPQLAAVKPTEAMHRERLATAAAGHIRYLVAMLDGQVVGFAVLALEQPAGWPPVGPLTLLLDVLVLPSCRGGGIGTALVRAAEAIVVGMAGRQLFISVDPRANALALKLYRRLGFVPVNGEPYESPWSYTDADGQVHSGVEWCIDLCKVLVTEPSDA